MSQTPPPPDDHDAADRLILQGDKLAAWFLAQIAHRLAPAPGKVLDAPFLRWIVRHYLLPAEAILRRTLHLIAARLPLPAAAQPNAHPSCHPGARRGPAQKKSAKPRTPRTPRPLLFRLTEPLPRPRTDHIPVNQRPRISIAGTTPPEPVRAKPAITTAEALEARLRRRIAALQAAWDDPGEAALRLHRLKSSGAIRHPALSFTKIPGAGANTLNNAAAPILESLNHAAFEAAAAERVTAADTS